MQDTWRFFRGAQDFGRLDAGSRAGFTFVMFFTLTDRASTIPSNIRGCQSGTVLYCTWPAGEEKVRGTSAKLQR